MAGAINLFTAIDPHVERIVTRAGDILNTTYVGTATGWRALQPTKPDQQTKGEPRQ
jgi:hypothetical protein